MHSTESVVDLQYVFSVADLHNVCSVSTVFLLCFARTNSSSDLLKPKNKPKHNPKHKDHSNAFMLLFETFTRALVVPVWQIMLHLSVQPTSHV